MRRTLEDALYRLAAGPGRAAVRACAGAVLRAFSDFHDDVLDRVWVAPDGTRCAIPWRITATHSAPLTPPGFAPTGDQLRQQGTDGARARWAPA